MTTLNEALEKLKPREWWLDIATPYGDPCDFIHDEDPYKAAARNGTYPCISATNIHVIERKAYDRLKAAFKLCVQQRDEWAVPGSGSDIEDLLNKDNAALIEALEGKL